MWSWVRIRLILEEGELHEEGEDEFDISQFDLRCILMGGIR